MPRIKPKGLVLTECWKLATAQAREDGPMVSHCIYCLVVWGCLLHSSDALWRQEPAADKRARVCDERASPALQRAVSVSLRPRSEEQQKQLGRVNLNDDESDVIACMNSVIVRNC